MEAPSFQDMTFGAETKKACLVDLGTLTVSDGAKLYPLIAEGKDADTVTQPSSSKVDYIFDSEPKMKLCCVFAVPSAAPALKIQSSQFEPIPLTVR